MTDEELEMMAQEAKKMAGYLTTEDTASDEVQSTIDGIVSQHMSLHKENKKQKQENKILRKALELACQEIKSNESGRCGGLFYIQKIKADYGIGQMTYYDIFIKLAKKELEKEQKDDKR